MVVALYNARGVASGNIVATLRIPTLDKPPGIVKWQNAYYVKQGVSLDYVEATMWEARPRG